VEQVMYAIWAEATQEFIEAYCSSYLCRMRIYEHYDDKDMKFYKIKKIIIKEVKR
jgi:hypothetical protein